MVFRGILLTISLLLLNVQGKIPGKYQSLAELMKNESLSQVMLNETDPLAVCNDGSSTTYIWKKSPTNSNKWLILLAGGGSCWDEESCLKRTSYKDPPYHHLYSSVGQPKVYDIISGILSPDKDESPMWDANKVLLHHCSSDFFMGGLGGPDKAETYKNGWYYRGQNAVNAMMKHVMYKQGLVEQAQHEQQLVVFGGLSAGAVAASYHIDNIAQTLKPFNAKTLGFFDSALYFNTPPLRQNNGTALGERIKSAYNNFNATALVAGTECSKDYDQANQWKCLVPEYRFKYLKTPFILVTDQYDDYHLGIDMGEVNVRGNLTQEEKDHVMEFGKRSKEWLTNYDLSKQQAFIFAPACGFHAVSSYPAFWKNSLIETNGFNHKMTQRDLVQEAIDDIVQGKELRKKYIDDCQGVRCNPNCKAQ